MIHTYTHTYIPTYLHTYIYTDTYKQTDRQAHIHTYIQTDKQKDRQTDKQTDGQTHIHTHIHMDKQKDRRRERQRDRKTDRTRVETSCLYSSCIFHPTAAQNHWQDKGRSRLSDLLDGAALATQSWRTSYSLITTSSTKKGPCAKAPYQVQWGKKKQKHHRPDTGPGQQLTVNMV